MIYKPQKNSTSNSMKEGSGELIARFSTHAGSKRWFVIRSKPRQEEICIQELSIAGFEAVCPMRMEYRFRRRRKEAVALFPGYVFCKMRYPEDYYKVRWTKGVLHMVRFGETPPPALEDDIVGFFIESMNEDGVMQTGPEIEKGDSVEFLTEPMRGLVGTVLRINSAEQRVHVLMDLLYQATIEVERYQIQAI